MAEKFIHVHFEDRKVRRALRKMGDNCKDLHKVFRGLRPSLRDNLQKHADAEESPTGSRWPQRATSTMEKLEKRAHSARTADAILTKRKRRRSIRKKGATAGGRFAGPLRQKQILSLLGKLPIGVKTMAKGAALEAASTASWAGIHNEGGVAGHGARIPEREFVAFSGEFLVEASDDLIAFVHKGWASA